MARPRLPVGTFGTIRVYRLSSGKYRARTMFRDYDGKTREVERVGETRAKAETALKQALRDRARIATDGEITPTTRVGEVGRVWLAEVSEAVARGKKSPNTLAQYQYRFERHIDPALGGLLVREVTVGRANRVIQDVYAQFGASAAKTTRTVLGGLLGLAVRHDAMERNPVRELQWIGNDKAPTRALTFEEAIELRERIHSDDKAKQRDLIDFTDIMLATGLRIGEAAALTWPAVDLDAGTIEVRGTVIRVKGEGLRIKWQPKSKSGYRSLQLPDWAAEMIRARHRAKRRPNEWDAVFTAPEGGLRDPSNTQADLRELFAECGYEWVTSHVYRKTVATLMDRAGLSARQAADQLGHAKVSMTQDNYFGRRVAPTGAATVLAPLGQLSNGQAKSGG